jgi:uncharacterized protein with HEPN domain
MYLIDIVEAADAIDRFLGEMGEGDFLADDLRQSAILQKLIIIGEAAARVSKELRAEHSYVNWADIVAFRNIAVHAYFSVDWNIVWFTATNDVPNLRMHIQHILRTV